MREGICAHDKKQRDVRRESGLPQKILAQLLVIVPEINRYRLVDNLACSHPNLLVLPFRLELIRVAA